MNSARVGTRFVVQVQGGQYLRDLHFDLSRPLCPQVGSEVQLAPGVYAEVARVTLAPTMDPLVWVTCWPIMAATQEESDLLVERARAEGWKVDRNLGETP